MKNSINHKVVSVEISRRIDAVLTHRIWGVPIFFFFMFLLFEATFVLGAYPIQWIENGVAMLSGYLGGAIAEGSFKDLLIDGVIGGVGGVIVFLPNILILYLLISIMEDSGYMSRAASIMDKGMRRIGLHGQSFIPLVMGFGCNVPAIMASSTVDNRSSRLITIFVSPFMSCSARLNIYVLLAGAFFPNNSGIVLFGLYLLGILLAVITALILRKFIFKGDQEPFEVELEQYRLPSARAAISLMWDKSWQYLRKMGGVILIASIAVWFLSYYPHNSELPVAEQQKESYMGRIGVFCEPVMRPLGLEWKANVALISGVAAKELVISTLGVLYSGSNDNRAHALSQKLTSVDTITGRPDFTVASAISFMVFVLLYFPCIATVIAISIQSGSWKWAAVSVVYNTALAWVLSLLAFQMVSLIV